MRLTGQDIEPLAKAALEPAIAALIEMPQPPGLASLQGPRVPVAQVRDVALDAGEATIAARLYMPQQPQNPLPLIAYFHGGGWSRGDLELYDKPCRALAAATGCALASVDYRLAPAHRFPVGLLDCYAATRALAENAASWGCDPARLIVAGDSAGGNLAAAVCLLARDRGGPRIAHQVLIYPPLEARMTSASYRRHAHAPFLDTAAMRANFKLYIDDAVDLDDPWLSPLSARDLGSLPPALIVTAEIDPVSDDAERYANRLAEAGSDATTVVSIPGIPHMALHMRGISAGAARLYDEIGRHLRDRFQPASSAR